MRVFWMWMTQYSGARWTGLAEHPLSGVRLSANSEIAWHFAEALRAEFGAESVISLDMGNEFDRDASGALVMSIQGVAVQPDDVFVGHLGPWAEQAHDMGLRYLPMVAWPNKMAWPYSRFVYHEQHQRVLDRTPTFIPLCGAGVWQASKRDAMLSRWHDKGQQLELGFSRTLFPQVKRTFNPPGKRGFLYVGQASEQKGVGPMLEAFKDLGYRLDVGNGELSQASRAYGHDVRVLGWLDNADQPFWSALAEHVDFMVCPTLWDCQPVSPMECLSRGWPIIGTRWACIGNAIELKDDLSDLRAALSFWQNAPTELLQVAQERQLSWMNHELRWEPVLERFRAIIRAHLGGGRA